MEGKSKLNLELYEDTKVENYFGKWYQDSKLQKEYLDHFKQVKPYPFIVIDDFLDKDFADLLAGTFPKVSDKWHHYNNPIEVKYALDNLNEMPQEYKDIFHVLCLNPFLKTLENITEIKGLEHDPYLHGAGLHAHPVNGRLNIHLDYEKHPFMAKERRLNIILFLSKDWKEEWKGGLELWKPNMSECEKTMIPKFNTAVLFRTDGNSFHGLPEKLKCPENVFRQSLAIYYISDLCTKKSDSMYRYKAKFVKRPFDPFDERMAKLYEIRANRRISEQDMKEIWPEWNSVDN